MTDAYTPTTAYVKEKYASHQEHALARKQALAEFNRWLTAELEAAREQGRQEGLKSAAEPESGYIVFEGPHEYCYTLEGAERRLEDLAEYEQRYATLVKVFTTNRRDEYGDTVGPEALGFSVRPPLMVTAEATGSL